MGVDRHISGVTDYLGYGVNGQDDICRWVEVQQGLCQAECVTQGCAGTREVVVLQRRQVERRRWAMCDLSDAQTEDTA